MQSRRLGSTPLTGECPWRYREQGELLGQLLALVQGRDSCAQGVHDGDVRRWLAFLS